MTNQTTCKTCYQIACRKCDWVATDDEVFRIKKGEMTACPQCGWKPGEAVSNKNNAL